MAPSSIQQLLLLLPLLAPFSTAVPLSKRSTINFDVLGDNTNFPDPCIIIDNGVAYAFGTNGEGYTIPVAHNSDFSNPSGWSGLSDAFPLDNVPAFGDNGWATAGQTWAPDVNHLTDYDGSYAMYYSAQLKNSINGGTQHCLGLARSGNVAGPYNDSSSEPFICPKEAGGAIDVSGFLDNNNDRYVVYKIDGQAANNNANTSLMLQQVQNDGYTVIGGPSVLWNNQGESDGYNTEAPIIVRSGDGVYFLFFSTGFYGDDSYTTSYVTSTNGVGGPYGNPQTLLKTGDDGLYAPGGMDMDQATGDIVLHSFTQSNNINDGRVLDTGRVTLSGQTATVQ